MRTLTLALSPHVCLHKAPLWALGHKQDGKEDCTLHFPFVKEGSLAQQGAPTADRMGTPPRPLPTPG